jgi:hypothetical protein
MTNGAARPAALDRAGPHITTDTVSATARSTMIPLLSRDLIPVG